MKRLFILFTLICQMMAITAQNADFQKAAAKYKNVKTVTAAVVKTTHKNAIAQDVTSKGTLTMKAPSEVCIAMEGGKDMLLMQGTTFTMMMKGKKHVTNSQTNTQFSSLQTVFESLLTGGSKDITKLSDLTFGKQGSILTLTITPQAKDKKAAKRMLFSSLVLTIDTKNAELKALRMNERAGYTEYTFSGYQFK